MIDYRSQCKSCFTSDCKKLVSVLKSTLLLDVLEESKREEMPLLHFLHLRGNGNPKKLCPWL